MPPTTLTSIEEARTWTISTNFVREDQFIVGTRNDSHKHGDGGSISAKSAGGKITHKPVVESPSEKFFGIRRHCEGQHRQRTAAVDAEFAKHHQSKNPRDVRVRPAAGILATARGIVAEARRNEDSARKYVPDRP